MTLSQICRSSYQQTSFPFTNEITDDMRRKFDHWWNSQLVPASAQAATAAVTPKLLPFVVNPSSMHQTSSDMMSDYGSGGVGSLSAAANHSRDVATAAMLAAGGGNTDLGHGGGHHHSHPHHHAASVLPHHHNHMIVHPALQTVHSQYPSQKTRMRTSFDPEMELPKLQRWFAENPHPSRQQIQSYVIQLNSLESRRGRKPLDVNNVVYWFKNARAAQKRAELRCQGMGNGFGPQQSGMNIIL